MKLRLTVLSLVTIILYSSSLYANNYKVAVRAHHGIKTAVKQWKATIELLNNRFPQHKFSLVPIKRLQRITEAAGNGDVDFVLTNPSSYIEIENLYNAKALVTLNNKRSNSAQNRFGSVIFTKFSNTKILNLEDIKDKSLMAVSRSAFGGWRVAWFELLEQGINPYRDLKKLSFAKGKTQPEVVWAVFYGKADVGVVRTDLIEDMIARGHISPKDFRILNKKIVKNFPFFLSTKLYPEWAFAVLKHVPAKLAEQVKNTLMTITKSEHAAISGKYIGWIQPLNYNSVRKLMKRLEVGPYRKIN